MDRARSCNEQFLNTIKAQAIALQQQNIVYDTQLHKKGCERNAKIGGRSRVVQEEEKKTFAVLINVTQSKCTMK